MNIHTAYTIYNNGIQSVEPQLAEAIDRIIDDKNKQLEKLDRVELAEVKLRIELEAVDGYYSALLKKRVLQVEELKAENERLRETLKTIAYTPKFKQQCEVESYAGLALEGREDEWVKSPFSSEVEVYQEALDRKNEVHDALNRDYVKVRDENKQLKTQNDWLILNMINIAEDKNWRIAAKVLEVK